MREICPIQAFDSGCVKRSNGVSPGLSNGQTGGSQNPQTSNGGLRLSGLRFGGGLLWVVGGGSIGESRRSVSPLTLCGPAPVLQYIFQSSKCPGIPVRLLTFL